MYLPTVTAFFLAASVAPVIAATTDLQVIALCDDTHYRHSEGSAIVLPDGKVLLVWTRFDGHKNRCGHLGDNGPATLVMAESIDDGRTWTEPVPLPVGTASRNIMQAAFVPVKDRLMLAFSVRMREGHTSTKYAIESTDGGKTWSERRKIVDAGGANDRCIRLGRGRILMALHNATSERRVGGKKDRDVLVAASDDEGRTWTVTNPIPHVPHPMETRAENPLPLLIAEPALAECSDGSVFMLARSSVGVFYQSRSSDGGTTWSDLEPTTIPTFAAPPYLFRVDDGRIGLLWNPIAGRSAAKAEEAIQNQITVPYGPRQRLAMMLSSDDGKTWSEPITVAEDGRNGFCYPWTYQAKDRTLRIFCSRTPEIIYPTDLVQLPPLKLESTQQ